MSKQKTTTKPVITTPDPRLRQKSTKVNNIDDEAKQIISEMVQSCIDWENEHEFELSAAMAAPQLGYNRRIIVVREDMSNKDNANFIALINPEVIKTEGKTLYDYEGCLSVPTIYGKVPRPAKARIKAVLEDGTEVRLKAQDFLARTLLHEIDHLNGILFIDHIKDQTDALPKVLKLARQFLTPCSPIIIKSARSYYRPRTSVNHSRLP